MSRKSGLKSTLIILFIAVLIFIGGCTSEKAEAIKVAAEQFRVEAVSALDQIENLYKQSVSMPAGNSEEKIKKIAELLEGPNEITPVLLNELLSEGSIGLGASNIIGKEFEGLSARYSVFEGMFRSLPAGSFFSKDAVKKAEKHAINLTLEFIRFADKLKSRPVQFTGRRVLILEKVAKGKMIQDENLRKLNLRISAQDILELETDEKKAKEGAILQCLKAAEAGKLVAGFIRDYEKLSVGDVLALTKDSLGFISEISDGNLDSLMNEYKSIETTITNDPYWSKVLDINININH